MHQHFLCQEMIWLSFSLSAFLRLWRLSISQTYPAAANHFRERAHANRYRQRVCKPQVFHQLHTANCTPPIALPGMRRHDYGILCHRNGLQCMHSGTYFSAHITLQRHCSTFTPDHTMLLYPAPRKLTIPSPCDTYYTTPHVIAFHNILPQHVIVNMRHWQHSSEYHAILEHQAYHSVRLASTALHGIMFRLHSWTLGRTHICINRHVCMLKHSVRKNVNVSLARADAHMHASLSNPVSSCGYMQYCAIACECVHVRAREDRQVSDIQAGRDREEGPFPWSISFSQG